MEPLGRTVAGLEDLVTAAPAAGLVAGCVTAEALRLSVTYRECRRCSQLSSWWTQPLMTAVGCRNHEEAGNTPVPHQMDLASLECYSMEGLKLLLAGSMELPLAIELVHMASKDAARTGQR